MAKKKGYNPMDSVKGSMGVGIASMAGMGAMGAMGSIPGMPAQAGGITNIASSGLALANVGQLSKNAMDLTRVFSDKGKNCKYGNGKGTLDIRARRILGK